MIKVVWKSFINFTIEGKPYRDNADLFNKDFTLLDRIKSMPEGNPISIHQAFTLYLNEIVTCLIDDLSSDAAGEVSNQDWVQWISDQGFKIALKGDEYEIQEVPPSEKK